MDSHEECRHLREQLKFSFERLSEFRELLEMSLAILKSKGVIVLKKDDELRTSVELYVQKLSEHGIGIENQNNNDTV